LQQTNSRYFEKLEEIKNSSENIKPKCYTEHIDIDEEIKQAKDLTKSVSTKEIGKEIGTEAAESSKVVENAVLHAKKSFVEFLEGLLKSFWVRLWFIILSYFVLACFVWFVGVSLYDMLYHDIPKQFFVKIWGNSIEFLKLLFAIIGAIFVFIKLFLNGKP
jgi:hypothetical protein